MTRLATVLVLLLLSAVAASAQWGPNDASRFFGSWQADEGMRAGSCTVELSGAGRSGQLGASTRSCFGQLAYLKSWSVGNGRIELLDHADRLIATLGAEGNELAGRLSGGSAVRMSPRSGQVIARAAAPTAGAGCIVIQNTNRCADAADITAPPRYPAQGRSVTLLNARSGLDPNSPITYQLQPGQCFAIDACFDTSVGLRCRIPGRNGMREAYVTKLWPTGTGGTGILFTNSC